MSHPPIPPNCPYFFQGRADGVWYYLPCAKLGDGAANLTTETISWVLGIPFTNMRIPISCVALRYWQIEHDRIYKDGVHFRPGPDTHIDVDAEEYKKWKMENMATLDEMLKAQRAAHEAGEAWITWGNNAEGKSDSTAGGQQQAVRGG